MTATMEISCTFTDCIRRFSSEKEMIRHKVDDPDHEYCKRCKLDFDTEEEMFMHVITSPRHELACVGCRCIFARASLYMHHVETDDCDILTRKIFDLQRAQKQLIKDAFQMRLNAESSDDPMPVSKATESAPSTEDGGVALPLLDTENPPLSGNSHGSGARSILEERRDKLNVNPSQTRSLYERSYDAEREDWPELGGLVYKRNGNIPDQDEDLIDLQSRLFSNNKKYQFKDSTGTPAAKRLFPGAGQDRFRGRPDRNTSGQSTNTADAYDDAGNNPLTSPTSHSSTSTSGVYDVLSFFDGILHKFVCPSSRCALRFDTAQEFQKHLIGPAHTGGSTRCPLCFRIFRSAFALVAHCESSTTRCKINQSANYNQILREITGDLIGTQGLGEDGSVLYVADQSVLPKTGERPVGL
ncbi:MAG: hypothetical protein Q9160_001608 [Pyrenula sp. 1 TL-2023]